MNLWLVDNKTLINGRKAIPSDKKDWFIDVLCERLAEVSNTLRQFQEVIEGETMYTEPDVSDLMQLISDYNEKIKLLEIDKENLSYELNQLKNEVTA
jgi:hypothetical protein